jgi:RNA polymerase sigma-70 factor, ECF subfamily
MIKQTKVVGVVFMDENMTLAAFLESVERNAYLTARLSLQNSEDALDAVQDAMLKLSQQYANRPSAEWAPLFYRILRNRIIDVQRRNQTRKQWMAPTGASAEDEPAYEAVSTEPDVERLIDSDAARARMDEAIMQLPDRQREAFLLRSLDGLDVAETARVMGCTVGSVKTHYFRALQSLRKKLSEYMP